jgi:uncharacterized protein YjbI with pentapeptide repeats
MLSMANEEHVALLNQGVAAWDAWYHENANIPPDLSEAILGGADLSGVDLSGANLFMADLSGAILVKANLSGADLSGANLSKARLNEAVLNSTMLVNTDLTGADLTGCNLFGVSAWGLKLDEATKQQDLVITPWGAPPGPEITVDNIEVAQFIYLMLNNQRSSTPLRRRWS